MPPRTTKASSNKREGTDGVHRTLRIYRRGRIQNSLWLLGLWAARWQSWPLQVGKGPHPGPGTEDQVSKRLCMLFCEARPGEAPVTEPERPLSESGSSGATGEAAEYTEGSVSAPSLLARKGWRRRQKGRWQPAVSSDKRRVGGNRDSFQGEDGSGEEPRALMKAAQEMPEGGGGGEGAAHRPGGLPGSPSPPTARSTQRLPLRPGRACFSSRLLLTRTSPLLRRAPGGEP